MHEQQGYDVDRAASLFAVVAKKGRIRLGAHVVLQREGSGKRGSTNKDNSHAALLFVSIRNPRLEEVRKIGAYTTLGFRKHTTHARSPARETKKNILIRTTKRDTAI